MAGCSASPIEPSTGSPSRWSPPGWLPSLNLARSSAKVAADQWERTDRALLDGIAGGSLREGIVAGIRSAADVLAEHFPWEEGDRNEIPDRVIVRRE